MTDEELAEKYAKGNMHYEIAKRENGADYAKEVSSVTISQAFLAGLEYKNKENAELKEKISILLSCTNCPENKGGWICAKEYENKCLTQKIEFIKELEEEKCELLGIIQGKDKVIQELEKENAKLKKQVENWNCSNCRLNKTGCPKELFRKMEESGYNNKFLSTFQITTVKRAGSKKKQKLQTL